MAINEIYGRLNEISEGVERENDEKILSSEKLLERRNQEIEEQANRLQSILDSINIEGLDSDSIVPSSLEQNNISDEENKRRMEEAQTRIDRVSSKIESLFSETPSHDTLNSFSITSNDNNEYHNQFNSYCVSNGLQNIIYECEDKIKGLGSDLSEEFKAEYNDILTSMKREFNQTGQVLNTRTDFYILVGKVRASYELQIAKSKTSEIINKYNIKQFEERKLYLDDNNVINLENMTNKNICDYLQNNNFDELIIESVKKVERKKYNDKFIRKETTVPASFDLNVSEFISNNSSLFMAMLQGEECLQFLWAMHSLENRLINNELIDKDGKSIKTSNIGLDLRQQFVYFLVANLVNINEINQENIVHYCSGIVNNTYDPTTLMLSIEQSKNVENGLYNPIIESSMNALDDRTKEIVNNYIKINYPELNISSNIK